MAHAVLTFLLVAAFAGAGVLNALGLRAMKADFVRWGFPDWWCYLTGGLEIGVALLIALPGTRTVGLIGGAVIVAAATLTVLRHGAYSHLRPLGLYAALLALVAVSAA